ncbi:glycosyltransferase [Nocardioides cheoyonin]|uniref:glycosyltransferase n=1 Tax=Nocardioides cheoyonin TaxID=3156615 RepID=UPI0032B575BF
MRIAQLANFVGPTSGGMKTALDALARGYVASGVERLLVVPGPTDDRYETQAGDVVQVRAPRVGGGYRLIVEPWKVVEALTRFAPTSLEVSDKFTLMPVSWWARRQGIGTVLFSHERMDEYMLRYTRLDTTTKVSIGLLNRILVRSFDALLVTSDYARHEFATLAAAAECPIVQVPLGVDLDRFRPRHHTRSEVLRLIHVGRLSREKSPDLSVGTAVELHRRGVPLRLDVYGDGPQRDEVEELAGDAPVVFHGHVSDRDEIAARLAEADVALSVCPGETFGLAVLEALASGTPVVTADRGGARELVDADCGACAAPEPSALADAVLDLAARPLRRTRAAARSRAERFPWSRTVAEMLDLHAAISAGLAEPAYA